MLLNLIRMKGLLFDRDVDTPLPMPPEITVFSDSAITSPRQPVFLPEFDSEWLAEFYLAVRVSRLGKDIPQKFSPRYFDQFTVAMRLVPVTLSADFRMRARPSGVVSIFDNALTLGQWLSADSLESPAKVSVNDVEIELPDVGQAAAAAVSAVSHYCTLKTGDLVMPFRVLPAFPVKIGTLFTVSFGSETVIDIKIH